MPVSFLLKNKAKKLFQTGKSIRAIADELGVPRATINRIRQMLIQDKLNWNKKKSGLESQASFIIERIADGLSTRQIYQQLQQSDLSYSYSTVAKFVADLKKRHRPKPVIPGQEAKVFFFYTGRFREQGQKVPVWVFLMKFTYSKYAWYHLVTDNSFATFLDCHLHAFIFFNGCPLTIKCNATNAFDLNSPKLWSRYTDFLARQGSQLVAKSNRSSCIHCPAEQRFFNERFRFRILHQNLERFRRELARWYTSEVNRGIHPHQKIIIKNFFIAEEWPALQRSLSFLSKQMYSHAYDIS